MELEDAIVFLTKGIIKVRRACKASHGGSRRNGPISASRAASGAAMFKFLLTARAQLHRLDSSRLLSIIENPDVRLPHQIWFTDRFSARLVLFL